MLARRFCLPAMLLILSSRAHAQSTEEQVASILARPVQSLEVTAFELRRYAIARVPKLTTPATAQEWTAETRRLRKHLLEDIVFRGWPREWVNSPPKFEDLGLIESGPGYHLRKLRYEIVPGFLSTAILYEPENLAAKVPAILNVNGHVHQPGKAIEYKQKRCINFAKRGIMALNLEWIAQGELTNLTENEHWFGEHLDLVGVNAVGLWYLAMRRGLDYLDRHPSVDRTRLGMTGLSGGGWQTIFLSALDERVAVSVPVAGYAALVSRIERGSDVGDIEQQPTDFFVGQDYTHLTAMRAPRPTMIIGNAEDDCCFIGPLVRPYIYDEIKPFFRLFGKEEALAYHENLDPGTHNYQLDNRLAAYRFFSKHFNLPGIESESPVDSEIKSYGELQVGLPTDNLTVLGLARRFALTIQHSPIPPTGTMRSEWSVGERDKLKSVVRHKATSVMHAWALANTKNKGVESVSYRFQMANGLSATGIWVKAITTPSNAPITIILNDQGKKDTSIEVSDRINRGEQVLTVDVLFNGELGVSQGFAVPLASMGDRPLGIEVSQLLALDSWLRATTGAPRVRIESKGLRSQLVSLIAAALVPTEFSEIVVHDGIRSLGYLLDAPVVKADLLCLDLYKEFDIQMFEAMAAPTRVTTRRVLEFHSN